MNLTIRKMHPNEYPLLDDFLYLAIYQPDTTDLAPKSIINKPELQVYIKDFGKQEDDYCFCAEVDNRVVGAVWVRNINGYGSIDDVTVEFAISVFNEYQKMGIGTALMNRMLEHLKELNYPKASLAVQKENYAVRMYQKVGFEIVDENEQEYIMIHRLGNKMTNKYILEIALQQSAYDCNCETKDFLAEHNIVSISKANPKARKYIPLPFECDLVSYGNNIVAQTSERTKAVVTEYINKYLAYRCFETPNINVLNELLAPFNLKVCFMAEYFLPDVTKLKELDCGYELRVLQKQDFADLYLEQWSNCLTFDDRERDVLAVGAYDDDKLIGLAGCSVDCETMYQIGVDVLPEYRRKGVASALTSKLSLEILKLGKVPFYCAAWSNIKSVRNAIKSGFYPAWVELTAREIDFVNNVNK